MGVLIGGSDAWWAAPMFYFSWASRPSSSRPSCSRRPSPSRASRSLRDGAAQLLLPTIKSWWLHVWERVSAHIKKAGTMSSSPRPSWCGSFQLRLPPAGMAAAPSASSPAWRALATTSWTTRCSRPSAASSASSCPRWALTPGRPLRVHLCPDCENLVSTPGAPLCGLGEATENPSPCGRASRACSPTRRACCTPVPCAFVAFNMLDAPCFAAMGTIRRQMDDTSGSGLPSATSASSAGASA